MSSSSLVFRMLQPYLRCLERYPIRTKSITAAVVLGTGDVLSQSIERRNKRHEMNITGEEDVHLSHDFVRTAKMCSYGLILLGPVLHNWYKALNMLTKAKPIQNVSTTKTGFMHSQRVVQIKNGLKQTFVDQTTAGPFCVAMFMVYMTAVDGKNVVEKLERDYVNAMKIYYKIWPLIQFSKY
jgi:protein Mpv17